MPTSASATLHVVSCCSRPSGHAMLMLIRAAMDGCIPHRSPACCWHQGHRWTGCAEGVGPCWRGAQVAREFREEPVMYFPHDLDFRGRAYPIHPHLNHMGPDLCRGLLTFAEARPPGRAWLRLAPRAGAQPAHPCSAQSSSLLWLCFLGDGSPVWAGQQAGLHAGIGAGCMLLQAASLQAGSGAWPETVDQAHLACFEPDPRRADRQLVGARSRQGVVLGAPQVCAGQPAQHRGLGRAPAGAHRVQVSPPK